MKYGDELLDLSGRRVTMARIISRITPAPLVNLYVGVLFSFFSPIGLGPILTPSYSLLICIVLMVILPVAPILLSAMRGSVDLDVSDRESRPVFFVFSLCCYVSALGLYMLAQCHIMSTLALAYFSVTLGVLFASFRTKASVHAAGVGGPGTALIFVYGPLALIVIAIWILVVWARTTLLQHTLGQSILGLAIGVVISTMVYGLFY